MCIEEGTLHSTGSGRDFPPDKWDLGSAVEQGEFWEEGIAGASAQGWEGMETREGGVYSGCNRGYV